MRNTAHNTGADPEGSATGGDTRMSVRGCPLPGGGNFGKFSLKMVHFDEF